MTLNKLIALLEAKREEIGGDVEVLITDGFNTACYRGDYEVATFVDLDGYVFADIGIGGCLE